jgi:hypothetical protein
MWTLRSWLLATTAIRLDPVAPAPPNEYAGYDAVVRGITFIGGSGAIRMDGGGSLLVENVAGLAAPEFLDVVDAGKVTVRNSHHDPHWRGEL